MRVSKYVGMAALAALLVAETLPAQMLDLTKRFQVISRKSVDKLQNDLNKAGENGIRVVTGSSTAGDRVALLLEKSKHKGDTYEYLVISESKPSKIEQRLSLGASQGFRLLPRTIAAKGKTLWGSDIVLVMEKLPRQHQSYRYLLLDTSLPSTLQVTLAGAVDQGYRVVSMVTRKKTSYLILEKAAGK